MKNLQSRFAKKIWWLEINKLPPHKQLYFGKTPRTLFFVDKKRQSIDLHHVCFQTFLLRWQPLTLFNWRGHPDTLGSSLTENEPSQAFFTLGRRRHTLIFVNWGGNSDTLLTLFNSGDMTPSNSLTGERTPLRISSLMTEEINLTNLAFINLRALNVLRISSRLW